MNSVYIYCNEDNCKYHSTKNGNADDWFCTRFSISIRYGKCEDKEEIETEDDVMAYSE